MKKQQSQQTISEEGNLEDVIKFLNEEPQLME